MLALVFMVGIKRDATDAGAARDRHTCHHVEESPDLRR
jgi:hypothetical protein